ncbi:sensor histidine kinase [Dactylosporangium sp. NPDC005572]|uniref:sensor histidine kinase n=1 Tax=Dactylosporangium sp. NPDC005572 TaxID=3156889 RepID=UPI0033A0C91F
MGAATCGWTIGQLVWSWYRLFRGVGLPSPSPADAGYLTLPILALAAIIVLAADRPVPGGLRRRPGLAVIILDGLVVVGALFVLTWSTSLGSVVRAGAATPLAYTVAIAYPITDLLLAVIVILLVAAAAPAANRTQLIFLGAGLFCLAFSDSFFAYLVSSGAQSVPPPADAGFIAGHALVAVAALTPTRDTPVPPVRRHVRWGHLLLPYIPVAAAGLLLIWQFVRGMPMDRVEIVAAAVVILLLVVRQALTLAESAALVASRTRLVLAADLARRRLERDLHDGVQQRLVSLGLEVRRAEASVPDELPQLRRELATIADGLRETSDDMRELTRGVHPAMLTGGGLRPALRTLARRSALPVVVDVNVDGRLPEPVEIAAYYVVAEALTNAAKHAHAGAVEVGARVHGGALHLWVHDDGIGGANLRRGTGLIGLSDRVEALGGVLTVDSPPGQGTRLWAELPLDEPPGEPASGALDPRSRAPHA